MISLCTRRRGHLATRPSASSRRSRIRERLRSAGDRVVGSLRGRSGGHGGPRERRVLDPPYALESGPRHAARWTLHGLRAYIQRGRRGGPMAAMNYCPRCANPLTTKHDGGRDRQACPDESCGFIHFGDFSIGCSGVVLREEDGLTKALLVQRGEDPFAGSWQLPGGYAEHDEPLSLAVEREVEEEASVIAKVRDVIAFRHSLGGTVGGPSTNIYIIFSPRSDRGRTAARRSRDRRRRVLLAGRDVADGGGARALPLGHRAGAGHAARERP